MSLPVKSLIQVKTLGKYQMEWLNRYHEIDLTHWRMMCYEEYPDWYYVGYWRPGEDVNQYYLERDRNLTRDKYYYWPK